MSPVNLMGYAEASVNEETGEVTLTFLNRAEADDPDPIAFTPTHSVTVTLPSAVVTPL